MLRALGTECDRTGMEVSKITETDTGFTVAGLLGGRFTRRVYEASEILRLVALHQARRRPPDAQP